MVGLPGSGKSYVTNEILNKQNEYEVLSSDLYRKKLYGDENDQTHNQEVFVALYKDMRQYLSAGKNCIFDATNTTRKARARIFNQLKGIENIEIEAYVMRTPFEVCVENDLNRERTVGYEVIKNFLYSYEFPQKFEGFDKIIIDNFPINNLQYITDIIAPIYWETLNKMKKFDQENPHHIHNLYDHCFDLAAHFPQSSPMWRAGILHDVGKLFTRHYDEQNIAHYYSHDSVGTYYILSTLLEYLIDGFYDYQDIIEYILFLINYHMKGHKDFRGKNEFKYRKIFGDKWYNDLIRFADADIDASGTESIHEHLQQWIKVDKLTLKEIKNKEIYLQLLSKKS